ncbi:MAG: 2-phosphosulfolactate phosphatase [Anaerolineales bacterium]|nr:2-phosphosulfolactate phosphatase [Anaerolineales bacterium]
MMYFDQSDYEVRFEWGLQGIQTLAPICDVVVIVDVLSFTSCVDIVVGNGGTIFPYRGKLEGVAAFAGTVDALFATHRAQTGAYSLSPSSLIRAPAGTRLVLPSPNGSTLSLSTADTPTLAGCLRNAQAVAAKANELGKRIGVIAAGERWPDKTLRPSLEDLLGAGAIITHLHGRRSPEAEMAAVGFAHTQSALLPTLLRCGSGKELVGRGFEADVHLAAQLNVSRAAPVLIDGAYVG